MLRLVLISLVFISGTASAFEMPQSSHMGFLEDRIGAAFGRTRMVSEIDEALTTRLSFQFVSEESMARFGLTTYDQTKERSYRAKFRQNMDSKTEWLLELGSYSTGQDIKPSYLDIAYSENRHRLFYIHQGWKRELWKGLDYQLLIGTGRCENVDKNASRFVPILGASLHGKGEIHSWSFQIGQLMRGNSFRSGIYGGEVSQQMAADSTWNWTDSLRIEIFCELAMYRRASEEQGLMRESPTFLAGVNLLLKLKKRLSAKIGYGHRSYLGSLVSQTGPEGPLAHAELNYTFF